MSSRADLTVSMPRPDLDPLFSAVTPIIYPSKGGHATGFYFVDAGNQPFLITNHHVVANERGSPTAENIRILTRPSPDITEVEFHTIPLIEDGNPTWIEHPQGSIIDVVAIPLSFDTSSLETVALHSGLFPSDGWMPITQHGTIIGYPLLEKSPFLPILRDATIASPYGTTYRDAACFAMDASMHSGTSGSPVFALPESSSRSPDMLGHQLHLIGVHSATLYAERAPQDGALDLNIAWYIQLLEDMIDIG